MKQGCRRWCSAAVAFAVLFTLANASAESESPGGAGIYAGVFGGLGLTSGRLTDIEGFANWGHPGTVTNYDTSGLMGGALLGKRFQAGAAPLRFELDAAFGGRTASTDRLDPGGRDETARVRFRWVSTARMGIERDGGPMTLFLNGGVVVAGVVNSVTDIDFSRDRPPAFDPDDSFEDESTRVGWVAGLGVEAPLADGWTVRVDGSYLNFGRSTHKVNLSGNNPCGAGGPRRPCTHRVNNALALARLALIYRFGW